MKGIKRYHFISELQQAAKDAQHPLGRLKPQELKALVETALMAGVERAQRGERVRFPIIGALTRKAVKERLGGIRKNPFTGQEMRVEPRAASQKPRWSFPKALKQTFADHGTGVIAPQATVHKTTPAPRDQAARATWKFGPKLHEVQTYLSRRSVKSDDGLPPPIRNPSGGVTCLPKDP